MSFGTKLRILRETKGIQRSACDEIFHVMHGTVSNWENGYDVPDEELLPDIARFFGLKVRDLVSSAPLAG